jgi:hypothetical protein
MVHFRKLLVGTIGAVSLVGAASVSTAAHGGGTLIEFDSMTPVTGAAVGTMNDRGITGGGKAWVIRSGRGEVDRLGNVEVKVTGLVIPALGGINPIASFKATVSCLTSHGVVNVSTALFAASMTGNSTIEGRVVLPHPCKAPEVFVGNAAGAWFAMSSSEEDGED